MQIVISVNTLPGFCTSIGENLDVFHHTRFRVDLIIIMEHVHRVMIPGLHGLLPVLLQPRQFFGITGFSRRFNGVIPILGLRRVARVDDQSAVRPNLGRLGFGTHGFGHHVGIIEKFHAVGVAVAHQKIGVGFLGKFVHALGVFFFKALGIVGKLGGRLVAGRKRSGIIVRTSFRWSARRRCIMGPGPGQIVRFRRHRPRRDIIGKFSGGASGIRDIINDIGHLGGIGNLIGSTHKC